MSNLDKMKSVLSEINSALIARAGITNTGLRTLPDNVISIPRTNVPWKNIGLDKEPTFIPKGYRVAMQIFRDYSGKMPSTTSQLASAVGKGNIYYFPYIDMSNAGNAAGTFEGCSQLQEIAPGIVVKSNYVSSFFSGCSVLLNINDFKVEQAGTVNSDWRVMFANCKLLLAVNFAGWKSKISGLYQTFMNCLSIEYLDFSNENLNFTPLTSLYHSFEGCESLRSINLGGIVDGTPTSVDSLFKGCKKIEEIQGIENLNVSGCTNINDVFSGCAKIAALNLAPWDVRKVTDFRYTFNGCDSLTSLDLSRWQFDGKVYFYQTFSNCSKLKELKLNFLNTGKSYFKPSNNLYAFLVGCSELTDLYIETWDTSEVTDWYWYKNFTPKLEHIHGVIDLTGATNLTLFDLERHKNVKTLKIKGFSETKYVDSVNLSAESIIFILNNVKPVTGKTITFNATAFNNALTTNRSELLNAVDSARGNGWTVVPNVS